MLPRRATGGERVVHHQSRGAEALSQGVKQRIDQHRFLSHVSIFLDEARCLSPGEDLSAREHLEPQCLLTHYEVCRQPTGRLDPRVLPTPELQQRARLYGGYFAQSNKVAGN